MIAPSILNADNLSLKEQILEVKLAGIKRLHI
ncbi:MAG: ribulose-phosphate 3-epimerase, partial [Lactobacillus iners]|nr:ribulose-phosphate 3-epimerase [Lactobacillus iners]MCT7782742.1 ribulose-phosphate 3-epimerase [Lactobacillus iners]